MKVATEFEFGNWAEAFRRAPEIARDELMGAMREADMLLEREVVDATPTATGNSRKSIFSREESLPDGAIGVVATSQPHVAYLELGTRPHFPPVDALEDWVRVKFGYTDEQQIHGAALAIARKIAARGTLGVGMFHRTAARLTPTIRDIFSRAHARFVRRLAGG